MKKSPLAWLALALVTAVSAYCFQNSTTPWVPLGMGGNGFIDDFDLTPAPAGSQARYFTAAGVDSGGAWISFDEGESYVPMGGATFSGTSGQNKANGNVVKFAPWDSSRRTVLVGTDSGQVFVSTVGTDGQIALTNISPTVAPATVPGLPQPVSVFQTTTHSGTFYVGCGTRRVYYKAGKIKTSDTKPDIWKVTGSGTTWTQLPAIPLGSYSFAAVCNLAVDPSNINIVYAATDVGLFKYNGTSWSQLTVVSGTPTLGVFGLTMDPSSSGSVLYCTTLPRTDIRAFYLALIQPIPGATPPAAATAEGIYQSVDAGATWTPLTTATSPVAIGAGTALNSTGYYFNIAVNPLNPAQLYATYFTDQGPTSCVVVSTNYGSTWTAYNAANSLAIADYPNSYSPEILSIFPTGSSTGDVFICGDTASNYKGTLSMGNLPFASFTSSLSTVGTLSYYRGWGQEGGRAKYLSLASGNPSAMYYADADRGFWSSADAGTSWTLLYNPDNGTQGKGRGFVADPDDNTKLYGWSAFRTIDFAAPNHCANHFFKGSSTGTKLFPQTLSGVLENSYWDFATDAAAPRTMYLTAGGKVRYTFQIVFDNSGPPVFDVYMDGILCGSQIPYTDAGAGGITQVEFQIPGGTAATKFFVDNVSIVRTFQDPESVIDFSDSFEIDPTGSVPTNWAVTPIGATAVGVVAQIPHSSLRVMQLSTGTATESVVADSPALTTPESGLYAVVSFDLIFDDVATLKQVVVYGGGTNRAAVLQFSAGKVQVLGSSTVLAKIEDRYRNRAIYQTTSGVTGAWSDISLGLPGGSDLSHIQIDPASHTTLYCSDERVNGGVYQSVASGAWSKVFPTAGSEFAGIGSIATATGTSGTILYAGVNEGPYPGSGPGGSGIAQSPYAGIWKSLDGGVTWVSKLSAGTLFPGPAGPPADLTFSCIQTTGSGNVLVASSYGVLQSPDAGATWSWLNGTSIPCASTEFVTTATDSVVRHYTGMRTEGFGVCYELPYMTTFQRWDHPSLSWLDDWRNIPTLARVGTQAYSDAAWAIASLPAGISSTPWLFTTSMDDTSNTTTKLLQIKIQGASTVYVAVPAGAAPGWLSTAGFTLMGGTGMAIQARGAATTTPLDVWSLALPANNHVTLGGLGLVGGPNYIVLVDMH